MNTRALLFIFVFGPFVATEICAQPPIRRPSASSNRPAATEVPLRFELGNRFKAFAERQRTIQQNLQIASDDSFRTQILFPNASLTRRILESTVRKIQQGKITPPFGSWSIKTVQNLFKQSIEIDLREMNDRQLVGTYEALLGHAQKWRQRNRRGDLTDADRDALLELIVVVFSNYAIGVTEPQEVWSELSLESQGAVTEFKAFIPKANVRNRIFQQWPIFSSNTAAEDLLKIVPDPELTRGTVNRYFRYLVENGLHPDDILDRLANELKVPIFIDWPMATRRSAVTIATQRKIFETFAMREILREKIRRLYDHEGVEQLEPIVNTMDQEERAHTERIQSIMKTRGVTQAEAQNLAGDRKGELSFELAQSIYNAVFERLQKMIAETRSASASNKIFFISPSGESVSLPTHNLWPSQSFTSSSGPISIATHQSTSRTSRVIAFVEKGSKTSTTLSEAQIENALRAYFKSRLSSVATTLDPSVELTDYLIAAMSEWMEENNLILETSGASISAETAREIFEKFLTQSEDYSVLLHRRLIEASSSREGSDAKAPSSRIEKAHIRFLALAAAGLATPDRLKSDKDLSLPGLRVIEFDGSLSPLWLNWNTFEESDVNKIERGRGRTTELSRLVTILLDTPVFERGAQTSSRNLERTELADYGLAVLNAYEIPEMKAENSEQSNFLLKEIIELMIDNPTLDYEALQPRIQELTVKARNQFNRKIDLRKASFLFIQNHLTDALSVLRKNVNQRPPQEKCRAMIAEIRRARGKS